MVGDGGKMVHKAITDSLEKKCEFRPLWKMLLPVNESWLETLRKKHLFLLLVLKSAL